MAAKSRTPVRAALAWRDPPSAESVVVQLLLDYSLSGAMSVFFFIVNSFVCLVLTTAVAAAAKPIRV